MGKFRRTAAVAIGVTMATAIVGVVNASPASAAGYDALCVQQNAILDIYCAVADGSNPVQMLAVTGDGTAGPYQITNWYYPAPGTVGSIKQANVNLCMQLNASGGDTVRGAECVNDAAENWIAVAAGSNSSGTENVIFESVYDPSLCLSFNAAGSDLKADPCDMMTPQWYQVFMPLPK